MAIASSSAVLMPSPMLIAIDTRALPCNRRISVVRNLLSQALYIDPPLTPETFSFLPYLGEWRKYTYAIVAQMVPHFVNSLERGQCAAREMLVSLDRDHAPGGRRPRCS